jgi:hypothetical protein
MWLTLSVSVGFLSSVNIGDGVFGLIARFHEIKSK